jgi:hypothetical protein
MRSYFYLFLGCLTIQLALGEPSSAQTTQFECRSGSGNVPTTYAKNPDGQIAVFRWTSNFFAAPYTPLRRCQEVTRRMNKFSRQGQLNALTSGKVNRLPVICAGSKCQGDGSNVLLTLQPHQNAAQVLREITANRSDSAGPSQHLVPSDILQENADGSVTLDLEKHLHSSKSTPEYTEPTPQKLW